MCFSHLLLGLLGRYLQDWHYYVPLFLWFKQRCSRLVVASSCFQHQSSCQVSFFMAPKPKQRRKRDIAKVQQDRTKRTRKPKKPATRRKLPPYTPPEQKIPYGDAVGTEVVRKIRSANATKSKRALSLREILTKPEGDLACRYVSSGVFKDREGELCYRCGEGI